MPRPSRSVIAEIVVSDGGMAETDIPAATPDNVFGMNGLFCGMNLRKSLGWCGLSCEIGASSQRNGGGRPWPVARCHQEV